MNKFIQQFVKLRHTCRALGMTEEELLRLVQIWQGMYQGMLSRTANEILSTVKYTMFLKANGQACSPDEGAKQTGTYLLEAYRLAKMEMETEFAEVPVPQTF